MSYRQNPWFSPPAMQYVARFTGNPPKEFTFLARQGQHHDVERVLHSLGIRYCTEPMSHFGRGAYGRTGFLVKAEIPEGMSKRSINRALYEAGVPGATRSGAPRKGVKQNPWFSPPAMQYVARFTGMNPPGYGSSFLEYDAYEAPPGHQVFHNPRWARCPRCDRAIRPGTGYDSFGKTYCQDECAWQDELDDEWERENRNPRHNPEETHQVLCGCGWGNLAMKESEIPDYCPVCDHPVGLCAGCGERKEHCDCGEGARHSDDDDADWDEDTGRHPMADYYRQQGFQDAHDPDYDSYPNPPVRRNACYGVHFKQDKPFDVSQFAGARLPGPRSPLQRPVHEYLDNPATSPRRMAPASQFGMAAAWRQGDDGELEGGEIVIRGREVPVEHSKKGGYHHVRVADPSEFKAIRQKTLSAKKGIKARVGIFTGRGPRGGKSEIQSYLFDAKVYTPQDVARWFEGHKTPAPLLMVISSAKTSKRRMKVYGKEAEAPRKARKSVKKKAKKKPRALPAAAKRCTAKTKSGRCKGYKQAGKQQCALHAAGVAGKRQPKKKAKRRKVG